MTKGQSPESGQACRERSRAAAGLAPHCWLTARGSLRSLAGRRPRGPAAPKDRELPGSPTGAAGQSPPSQACPGVTRGREVAPASSAGHLPGDGDEQRPGSEENHGQTWPRVCPAKMGCCSTARRVHSCSTAGGRYICHATQAETKAGGQRV